MKSPNPTKIFLCFLLLSAGAAVQAQNTVAINQTAMALAQNIGGSGVSVSNATLNCPPNANGIFSAPSSSLGMTSGVLLTTGTAAGPSIFQPAGGFASVNNGYPGDPQLNSIAGANTYDACILEFDFVPVSNQIQFNYIFASEEYNEFVNTGFNDAFAFFISGPGISGQQNIALVPGTNIPVSINTINNGNSFGCSFGPCNNCTYFVDNCNGTSLVYDAHTTTLTATATVIACSTYHFKLCIADGGDGIYDSGVFLQENSLTSGGPLTVVVPNAFVQHAVCNTPGSATAVATGGIPSSYTFEWNTVPPQYGPTATGLTPGTYTVTVTSFDCVNYQTASASVTIQQINPVSVSIASTPVTCNGLSDGQATANVQGATAPITYTWTPAGPNAPTLTGLPPGTVSVSVEDANGCTASATAQITEPPPLTIGNVQTQNISCYGGSNGSVTVTPAGGNGGYTYTWTPAVSTNNQAINLSAGTYQFTVTDALGCQTSGQATVSEPPPLTVSITGTQDVSCFAGSNGSVTAQATGGTGQIGYQWNTSPPQNGATATNLPAGSYTVTATDANGCTATATAQITEPPQLQVSITNVQHVSCFGGNNGSATAVATGGSGTVTFAWNTMPVQTTATASNLSAGSYSVAAVDANGCLAGASVQITQPPLLTATATAQNASCHAGSDGSISGTATGGTPNYTFSWNNGALTGPNHSNLPAGTYTLLVTDANGCTDTAQVTIGQPAPLSVSITNVQNVSCNGLSDGEATAVASGGPGGYLYLWLPGNQTTATATGLSANTYTVYVTDNLFCDTVSATVTIQQPPPVQLSITADPDTQACAGTLLTLTASGAQNYQWAPTGETGSSVQVLLMNDITYDVTGTDANGCTGFGSISLTVLPNPTAALTADPAQVCAGRPITLDASGSSTPAPGTITSVDWDLNGDNIFEITNGGYSQSANTSAPGTYTVNVMVTNSDNCKHIQSLTYTVHPVPVAAFSAAAVCDGQAVSFSNQSSITPAQTLSYQWQFGSGSAGSTQAAPSYTYPGPGTYDVQLIVSSPHSCADTVSMPVTVHPNPTVAFTASPQCFNVVIYKVENPEQDLTYQWDLGDLNTASDTAFQHTYAQGGQYTVSLTATNSFGCEASVSQQVEVQNSVPLDKVTLPNILTPNGDGLNDVLVISENFDQCAEYEVLVFNRWGNLVYRYTHNGTPFEGKNNSGVRLQPGVYFYVIRSGSVEKNSSLTIVQ